MKSYFLASFVCPFIILSNTQLSFAQCSGETHSINIHDSWVSCQTTMNPNSSRGDSHWVLYDLGYVYSLGTTKFWNYNVASETGKGFKDLFIDYSIDGTNWIEAADFQLSEAPGLSNYTGEDGPDLSGIHARYVLLTAQNTWNPGSCAGISEAKFNVNMGAKIAAKVFLEGNFDSGLNQMSDDLRSMDLIPSREPYSGLGYQHSNGGGFESIDLDILNATGNDAIVDWLLMELRDKNDASIIVASKTVLLQKDGDVVDLDGISEVNFAHLLADDYYIGLKHRNHIGVRTATTHSLSSTVTNIDFTNDSSLVNGNTNGIKDIGSGLYALFSGDYDNNNQIQNADQSSATQKIGQSGYLQSDLDLNGQTQNTDVQLKLSPNVGKGGQY